MIVFIYDHTFEGLLTCVFDAYVRKRFPDLLQTADEPLPLFHEETITITTSEEKAARVWRALQKKLSNFALSCLTYGWLSELPEAPILLFRFICKNLDAPRSIETNFTDPDVLMLCQLRKKVNSERVQLMQFIRFQKASDGTYVATVEPQFNTLSLIIDHFQDRFADQPWLIYDVKRQYGYRYDLHSVEEVTFADPLQKTFITGKLSKDLMDDNEALFQQLWKTYFKSIAIKERWNPRKHRQDMPVRYWKFLTEKQ